MSSRLQFVVMELTTPPLGHTYSRVIECLYMHPILMLPVFITLGGVPLLKTVDIHSACAANALHKRHGLPRTLDALFRTLIPRPDSIWPSGERRASA